MKDIIIAERYAEALLEAAGDQAGVFAEEMERCQREDLFAISRFLDHPRVEMDKKEALIARITSGEGGSPSEGEYLLARFLKLLIARGRMRYLAEIFQIYSKLYRRKMGIWTGRVTLARPADGATLERIQGRIEQLLSCKLDLTWGEDATLLGGFIFSTETLLLDASIKRKLAELGARMKAASLAAA